MAGTAFRGLDAVQPGDDLESIATPFLFVDLPRLEANIHRMAVDARRLGVALRPHAKTHKVPEIARMQLEAGATGVTLAKVSEVEAFAAAGIEDTFLAYQVVTAAGAGRVAALAERMRLRCAVDSVAGAEQLSAAAVRRGVRLPVLVEIALPGITRTGVAPGAAALAVARAVGRLPGLDLAGVYGFRGYPFAAAAEHSRESWGRREGELLVQAAEALRKNGFSAAEVSAGSTPTALPAAAATGVTEVRPGQYVFGGANCVADGSMAEADVALFARATVISRPAPDRAVIDAGSKTLSSDGPWRPGDGFGYLASDPASRLVALWEEHGVVALGPESRALGLGDRVSVVPNHPCPAANLHDRLAGVRDGVVAVVWEVSARGRVW